MTLAWKPVSLFCLLCLQAAAFNNSAAASADVPVKKQPQTVSEVLKTYGPSVRVKLKSIFSAVDVPYPPKRMTWIGLKQEKLLLCFAPDRKGAIRKVLTYPIVGTCGVAGPKLKEGDMQIPEGFYALIGFRPNIIAHIGLDINYPNAEDKAHARTERRKNLGGDIMVHGHYISTGCLAMTDPPIEDLFILAYDTGLKKIQLILAPCNLVSQRAEIDFHKQPKWVPPLYERITKALKAYPI